MGDYNWISNGVCTVSEFLSTHECEDFVKLAEASGFVDAPINSTSGFTIRKDIRNNDRVVLDLPDRAVALWLRASDFVRHNYQGRKAIGLNERFRFYRYEVNQRFDWHRDSCFERPNGERSLITVLIYLNQGFVGGETSFNEPSINNGRQLDIVPQTGLALFFDHPLLHKGQPVQSGRKYVLRTDVMYAPV